MAEKRASVIIRGRVQGVGYRVSCQREALAQALTGWVRNRWDGSVEALFEGEAEAVDALLAWCAEGPPMADVTDVEIAVLPAESPRSWFHVRG